MSPVPISSQPSQNRPSQSPQLFLIHNTQQNEQNTRDISQQNEQLSSITNVLSHQSSLNIDRDNKLDDVCYNVNNIKQIVDKIVNKYWCCC